MKRGDVKRTGVAPRRTPHESTVHGSHPTFNLNLKPERERLTSPRYTRNPVARGPRSVERVPGASRSESRVAPDVRTQTDGDRHGITSLRMDSGAAPAPAREPPGSGSESVSQSLSGPEFTISIAIAIAIPIATPIPIPIPNPRAFPIPVQNQGFLPPDVLQIPRAGRSRKPEPIDVRRQPRGLGICHPDTALPHRVEEEGHERKEFLQSL